MIKQYDIKWYHWPVKVLLKTPSSEFIVKQPQVSCYGFWTTENKDHDIQVSFTQIFTQENRKYSWDTKLIFSKWTQCWLMILRIFLITSYQSLSEIQTDGPLATSRVTDPKEPSWVRTGIGWEPSVSGCWIVGNEVVNHCDQGSGRARWHSRVNYYVHNCPRPSLVQTEET